MGEAALEEKNEDRNDGATDSLEGTRSLSWPRGSSSLSTFAMHGREGCHWPGRGVKVLLASQGLLGEGERAMRHQLRTLEAMLVPNDPGSSDAVSSAPHGVGARRS